VTVRQIVTAMRRRWYVPLAVLACFAVGTLLMAQDGGIYTTRTVVSFLRPAGTSLSPDNGTTDRSVIAFAAAVALETNDGQLPEGYSKADAPYYGAGIRQGTLVELSNIGNQWVSTVNKAEIKIDIVGRSFDWVKSRQQKLIDRALSSADSLQDAVAVPQDDRVSAFVVPLTTEIDYIAPSRRALLASSTAMLAAAILVAAWASVSVDGALVKRRSDSARHGRNSSNQLNEGWKP
jgi:hypothetical protein